MGNLVLREVEIMDSTARSVSVTRSEEFFFVEGGVRAGLAEVIMVPARRARVKRVSWISWRLGVVSAILKERFSMDEEEFRRSSTGVGEWHGLSGRVLKERTMLMVEPI